MKKEDCVACGKKPLTKDEIGINKKLLGKDITFYYCIDCLADYLECTSEDIFDKIEEFRADGCELFK